MSSRPNWASDHPPSCTCAECRPRRMKCPTCSGEGEIVSRWNVEGGKITRCPTCFGQKTVLSNHPLLRSQPSSKAEGGAEKEKPLEGGVPAAFDEFENAGRNLPNRTGKPKYQRGGKLRSAFGIIAIFLLLTGLGTAFMTYPQWTDSELVNNFEEAVGWQFPEWAGTD